MGSAIEAADVGPALDVDVGPVVNVGEASGVAAAAEQAIDTTNAKTARPIAFRCRRAGFVGFGIEGSWNLI